MSKPGSAIMRRRIAPRRGVESSASSPRAPRKANRVSNRGLVGRLRSPAPSSAGTRSSATPMCQPASPVGWDDVIADTLFQDESGRVPSAALRVKPLGAPPASDAFKLVLEDIYTRKRHEQQRLLSAQRRREENAQKAAESRAPSPEESPVTTDDDTDEDSFEAFVQDHERAITLRRWALVRRKMDEMYLEKKKTSATLNWSFLRHAVQTRTTMEEVRQQLYKKYLENPNSWWTEGFINFPERVFDKARKPYTAVMLARSNSHRRKSKSVFDT
ncbi:hypothetical protein LSAT2_012386 [Lamellibrachia satsuma]|nr:hypothetical protein LSAT2_012386 [Lamellibrachia satsuma]